ncbi:MAG: phosphatase PAP2 family protein [Myxococcales bacterium]|nr:phosphatase PAP2 family protein [Myxococcales bacterium]
MQHFLESLIPWGYQVLQSIQQWHTPWLDTFFRIFTRLGDAEGYLLLLPLIYWCWDAHFGRRMSIGILYVLLFNAVIKLLFVIPRPSPLKIRVIGHATGPSFPSGHAQGVMTMAAYLGRLWRKPWFWLVLGITTLMIGFSRMYLGVHFPQDILGGWLLATLGLVLIWLLETPLSNWLAKQSLVIQLLLSLPLPLLTYFCFAGRSRVPAAAAVLGFSLGVALERRFVRFSSDGSAKHRMLRYLALLPLGFIMYGLKKLLPEGDFWRLIRYTSLGMFGTFVAPWFFIKFGIAQKETAPETAA